MENLKEFLESDEKSLDIPMMTIPEIEEALKQYGYRYDQDSFDTNGWQVDFWAYFNHENEEDQIVLSGSLYYGDYSLVKEKSEEF